MIVYQTDNDGILVDQMEADESPLEPGVYLIPARCVLRVPPPCPSGMRVRWTGDDWTVEAIPVPRWSHEQRDQGIGDNAQVN